MINIQQIFIMFDNFVKISEIIHFKTVSDGI